jgi:hypothetical protein
VISKFVVGSSVPSWIASGQCEGRVLGNMGRVCLRSLGVIKV